MTNDISEARSYLNDVFICFASEDIKFALKLTRALRNYKPPRELARGRQDKLKIFKDEGALSGTAYDQQIERQLLSSRKLVVVCSPKARENQDVNRKIRRFTEVHNPGNIISVIIEGIPNEEAVPGQEGAMAYPEALCEAAKVSHNVNYSGFNWRNRKINKDIMEEPWCSLVGRILDTTCLEVEQLEKNRRFQKRRRIILGLVNAFILTLIIWGIIAWSQKIEAEIRENNNQINQVNIYPDAQPVYSPAPF